MIPIARGTAGRRQLLRRGLRLAAASGLAAWLGLPALAQARRGLPRITAGPFYPPARPLDHDSDLTQVRGQAQRARGEWLDLHGVVIDTQGRVIDRAEIEIWQCDWYGSYRHPRGVGPQIDPGFQGFGVTLTAANGSYRFRTIRPVPYPGRTPHIHIKLRHPSFGEWISQLFVAGEPQNERDFLYRALSVADRQQVEFRLAPAPASCGWRSARC